jgi:hypothetical protein
MMDDPKTDDRTFVDGRRRPQAVQLAIGFPAKGLTETNHAMTYASDAFKRLTGYLAEEHHGLVRGASTGADGAMAYAENIFVRMKGFQPDHPHERDRRLDLGPARDDRVARGGRMTGMQADRAMVYAKDMFRRLRGLPEQEPLPSNRRQDEVRRHWCQRPNRSGSGLRNDGRRYLHTGSTAKTVSCSAGGFLPFLAAIGWAMVCLVLLVRRSILEPYARRRRRRIAITQLKVLSGFAPERDL